MIEATAIEVGYGGRIVVAGIDLHTMPGGVLGLIGPNGSGKTTLLRTLYDALSPTAGEVRLDATPVRALGARQVARRLAVVAQEGVGELGLSVAEMVLLGRSPHRSAFQSYDREDHRLAAQALHRVGARHLADRAFDTLSGGEKQRIIIARTLAQQADHLLLDEPTNHLDIGYQHEVLHLIQGLGVTTVIVLHDLNLAARYCDRLVLLEEGEIVAAGVPSAVLTPEILEPIYDVEVSRVLQGDCLQLLFGPRVAAEVTDRADDPLVDAEAAARPQRAMEGS